MGDLRKGRDLDVKTVEDLVFTPGHFCGGSRPYIYLFCGLYVEASELIMLQVST